MLRENVQNAYDAVLMRAAQEEKGVSGGRIAIRITGPEVVIEDNGIGMSRMFLEITSGKPVPVASVTS